MWARLFSLKHETEGREPGTASGRHARCHGLQTAFSDSLHSAGQNPFRLQYPIVNFRQHRCTSSNLHDRHLSYGPQR